VSRSFPVPISLILAGALSMAACATSQVESKLDMSTTAPSPDPRVGLGAGWMDAAQAAWNLRLVSHTPPSTQFMNPGDPSDFNYINSDMSFFGKYVIQGNFNGYQVWDISNPSHPTLHTAFVCPGSQSDVSIYRNLMFVSGEATNGRIDCGTQGVPDTVSHERLRGIRIFDITDIAHPRHLANIQTCRGSHTHTVVTDPNDPANVYVYVSGSAPVRSPQELPGCVDAPVEEDPNSALFRIEVIQVPLAAPEQAKIVSSPRIFSGLAAPARHGELLADSLLADSLDAVAAKAAADSGKPRRPMPPQPQTGPTQCHDITVYPAIGRAAGACGGYGLLLDISDAANPRRIGAVADSNFSYWHSATFNGDGTKILFSDEWGGGLQPRCRATDKYEWGADAIFTLVDDKMTFQSYYKMPAPQTPNENCVAHNGSLIPIPGRDIMAQGWYQGGVSVFDWTDPAHPKEIAYFDRGPMDSTKLVGAGSWSAYWYNGYIVSSEIARGLDLFELQPSGFISQNEIDAAKLVHLDYLNVQDQSKLVWPPSFVVPRAYLDQLERSNGLARAKVSAARDDLTRAEKLSGQQRRDVLKELATQLSADAQGAADPTKVRTLAAAVTDLANAEH
jgi:hypothetical protein